MPSFSEKSKLIFDSLSKGNNKKNILSLLPADARRRLLTEFANRQSAAVQDYAGRTNGTILDVRLLNLDKDGNIQAPHTHAKSFPESEHYFVINDIQFTINPTDISISDDPYHLKDWTMRTNGMSKVKSGRSVISINVSLPFVGTEEINTKLRRLVAQVRTIPICYVDNQLIRQVISPEDYKASMAVVVTNMSIMTHPESPDMLVANVSMEAFNYKVFSENFLYVSLPDSLSKKKGKDLQSAKHLKAPVGPKSTKGRSNPNQSNTNSPTVVRKPSQSLLYKLYYDFLLQQNSDINARIAQATGVPSNPKETSKLDKRIKLLLKDSNLKYYFQQVGPNLNNRMEFSYDVYHPVPYNIIKPQKDDISKVNEALEILDKAITKDLKMSRQTDSAKEKKSIKDAGIQLRYMLPSKWQIGIAFGWTRMPSNRNQYRNHKGIDIHASAGSRLWASYKGRVIESRSTGGPYGLRVILEHTSPTGRKFYTVYAHNTANLVSVGDEVSAGQDIAIIGMTGNAAGLHVHFELRLDVNDRAHAVDPVPYFVDGPRPIYWEKAILPEYRDGSGYKDPNLPTSSRSDIRQSIYEETAVEIAKKAQATLERWVAVVNQFKKKYASKGWRLVWTRNGTALFKKKVTLVIDPDQPIALPEGGMGVATPSSLAVTLSNIFAKIPMTGHRLVTHQYLGSGDANVDIQFMIKGNAQIGQLAYMHRYLEASSITNRRINNVGVLSLKNDVVNLCGSRDFIIDELRVNTVPSSPELYNVHLRLTEWNRQQREQQTLKQEFVSNSDLKLASLKKLGELFNRDADAQIVTNNKVSSFNNLIFGSRNNGFTLRVTLGTGEKVTLKNLSRAKKNVLGSDLDRRATVLDAAYVAMGNVVTKYMRQLANTNVFYFLGYTPEEFLQATNNENHPFYSFGFFNVLGNEGKKATPILGVRELFKAQINTFKIGGYRLPRTGAVKDFLSRVKNQGNLSKFKEINRRVRAYTKEEYDALVKKGVDPFAKQKIISREIQRNGELVTKNQKFFDSKAYLTTGGELAAYDVAYIEFLRANSTKRKLTNPISPQSTSLWLLAGALNAASSPGWIIGQILKQFDNPTNPDANRVKAALGNRSQNVLSQFPRIQANVSTGFDPTALTFKKTQIDLRDSAKAEQIKVAIAAINFFNDMRQELLQIYNTIADKLALHEEFEDVQKKNQQDNINFSGLPAYQDIPLPRVDVQSGLDYFVSRVDKSKTKKITNDKKPLYKFLNPDFYWFNPDDHWLVDLKRYMKFEGKVNRYFQSSKELAYQFGMVPGGEQSAGKPKGSPGLFALMGSNLGKHSGEIGKNNTILANRLPDSLFLSLGFQKLGGTFPKAKAGNGKLNMGISDSGISNESQINPYFINSRLKLEDLKKEDLPIYKTNHPLNTSQLGKVDRVVFGPTGMSELRFPVLLDRNPDSIVQTFQRSLVSYQRNTYKMRRAFPAFKLYFIEDDTGSILGSDKTSYVRSYDDFFSYSAIKEIKMVRSRKVPADTLIIRLSNLFGYLDDAQYSSGIFDKKDPLRPKDSASARESSRPLNLDTVKENPFTRFILKEGVRVQFRFGYENNPEDLATEFNGQITAINQVSGDEIVIVCQTFATQLTAYKKGLENKSLPTEWVDTFDLLSWAICQPEVSYFGRWQLDTRRSLLESRSTGGWEKVFSFVADPRDDNLFAPSRSEMITFWSDDEGGIFSSIFNGVSRISNNIKRAASNALFGTSSPEWIKTVGDRAIYRIELKNVPVWNPTLQEFSTKASKKAGQPSVGTVSKTVPYVAEKKGSGRTGLFYSTYGRGDSGLLDYHIYRTTIWDIFKEMELRHPGWIASPVPYGDRMTMFFGQPSQLYWHRPIRTDEILEQNQILKQLKNGLASNDIVKKHQSIISKANNPFNIGISKLPVVGWIYNNPWKSLAIGAGVAATGGLLSATGYLTALAGGGGGILSGALTSATAFGVAGTLVKTGAAVAIGSTALGLGKLAVGTSGQGQLLYATSVLSQATYSFAQKELLKKISGRLIPFRRYHLVTSENHIVANTIKASIHNTYNAISLEYTADTNTKSAKVGRPGYTTTKTMKASDRILDKDVRMGHFSYPNCRGSWMADRYLQGLLIRYMKDTYKGQLLLLGDPTIKPHDRILVMDSYTGMTGPVDVEQVVHTMSPSTGFLTEVTPDLVIYGSNITDMPFDDYMTAKIAFDRITWNQAYEGLVRFNGSYYQRQISSVGNPRTKGGQRGISYVDQYSLNREFGRFATNSVAAAGAGVAGYGLYAAGAALLAGGAVTAGASAAIAVGSALAVGGYFTGIVKSNPLSIINQLNPFFGSMAIKYYEWTTQRQPLIFQPVYVAGKPLLAGVAIDKVGMIQNFKDKFLPVLTKTKNGFDILSQAANSLGLQEFKNFTDQLPID